MDLFDILALIGGLALFLFGMQLMGDALEKKAGGQLKAVLGTMTSSKIRGFLLGLGVTAIIQSSSATTVMVVGFVNSGIMTLRQAISIIMGANIGTTVTSWLLSLTGIDGGSLLVQLLKPTSFTPVLALIGIVFCTFFKSAKKKDTGYILLGFATLMTGMDMMSGAVSGLKNVPEFTQILTLFSNPILGVLAGAVLTAIIQSSSASVGILQALSSTGAVSIGATIPIIMGQNIGTCVTAMISSVGANKNARRTALVHLYFNIIGTVVLLAVYFVANMIFDFGLEAVQASELSIAVVHTLFNLIATAMLFPFTGQLEALAIRTIRDSKEKEEYEMLDERLLQTPAVAVEQSKSVANGMASVAVETLHCALKALEGVTEKQAQEIRAGEDKVDKYEDHIGSYLVHLAAQSMTVEDSAQVTQLLHMIGDFERISDHAVNILDSAQEMHDKKLSFTDDAKRELSVLVSAVGEILDLTLDAFVNRDYALASQVEPLEQVIDGLRDELKKAHIDRLKRQECTIEMGFVLSDLLTNLERVSDHCSNIAGCMLEMTHDDMDIHEYLHRVKDDGAEGFNDKFAYYQKKYALS